MPESSYTYRPVWDPLLRGLHWWNAVMFFLQLIGGTAIIFFAEELPDAVEGGLISTHALFGYLFSAGLFTRILWLFVGTPTAKWNDLLPITRAQRKTFFSTLRFYAGFLRGTPPLYKAHNPFAGVIYALFFFMAAAQVLTGVIMYNMDEKLREKSLSYEIHEFGYIFIILFVMAHVFAVIIHELVERRSIVSSMIHGSKTFTEEEWKELKD